MKRSGFRRKTHAEILAVLREKQSRPSYRTLTRKTRLRTGKGMASGVGKKTWREIMERCGGECEGGCGAQGKFDPSHCFPRSMYKMDDRNESWNIENHCRSCHRRMDSDREFIEKVQHRAWQRRPKDRPIDRIFLPYMTEDEIEEWQNRTGGRFEHWPGPR